MVGNGIDVTTITDDLMGKHRVEIISADKSFEAGDSFTDYVFKGRASQIKNLVVTGKDDNELILSNLIIDTRETNESGNKIVLNGNITVSAPNLKLMLRGKDIEVNGTLAADEVLLEAEDGPDLWGKGISDVVSDLKKGELGDALSDAGCL